MRQTVPTPSPVSRRAVLSQGLGLALGAPLLASGLASLGACARRGTPTDQPVVVATSVDDFIARQVVNAIPADLRLPPIELVTDTEATKALALLQRILAERRAGQTRAAGRGIDLWWSGEVLAAVQLAREGALAPLTLPSDLTTDFPDQAWPKHLRDPQGLWHGYSLRARVIALSDAKFQGTNALPMPHTLSDLLHPRLRGQVGIARPQFGSTRSHVAALVQLHGRDRIDAFLAALRANDVRIYEGNSAAVRGVAQGEVACCLTDTDDVWVGRRNGWQLGVTWDLPARTGASSVEPLPAVGPVWFPATVALLASAPQPQRAATVAAWLLSAACEVALARTESRNLPARDQLRTTLAQELDEVAVVPPPAPVDWSVMGQTDGPLDQADALIARHFPL